MSERTRQWLVIAERVLALIGALVAALLGANQLDLPGATVLPDVSRELLRHDVTLPADPVDTRSVSCWSNPEWVPLDRSPRILVKRFGS